MDHGLPHFLQLNPRRHNRGLRCALRRDQERRPYYKLGQYVLHQARSR